MPTQSCNIITRNQKKKEEASDGFTNDKRKSKRIMGKPTPNNESKKEDDIEDTVKMTESNFKAQDLIQQKENSKFSSTSSYDSSNSNQETREFDPNLKCQIIETKQMIQFRKDNL